MILAKAFWQCRFPRLLFDYRVNLQGGRDMQYLLLIYEREADWNAMRDEEHGAILPEYMRFTQGIMKRAHHRAVQAHQPVATATTVRVRNGKTVTTDGPFAETREQLGGYYLVEAKDLDEAISLAARIPAARYGSVEVRPIMVYQQ